MKSGMGFSGALQPYRVDHAVIQAMVDRSAEECRFLRAFMRAEMSGFGR